MPKQFICHGHWLSHLPELGSNLVALSTTWTWTSKFERVYTAGSVESSYFFQERADTWGEMSSPWILIS
jgi:hypothetical protein